MSFPQEALPKDHFQGLGHLSTDESDSLRNLLNRMREASAFGGFQVDPDNADRFSTIDDAIAAASLELPAGEPIPIEVAMGKEHDLTTTLDGNRDVIIFAKASTLSAQSVGGGVPKPTILTGTISMDDADAQPNRRMLAFDNVDIDFNSVINETSNWVVLVNNGNFQADVNRTHGAEGARLQINNVRQNGGSFQIVDSDDAPSSDGFVHLSNGQLSMFVNAATGMLIGANVKVFIQNFFFKLLYTGSSKFIDFQSKSGTELIIENSLFTFESPGGDLAFVDNNSNSVVKWDGAKIVNNEGSAFSLGGSVGTHVGGPKLISNIAPSNPPTSTEWIDQELNDNLVWDGTYWGENGVYRQDVLVNIGSAALNHDIGFNVPSDGAVVSTAFKLLKALTGAGGAVQAGLGTGSGGDPDKYAETASLALGQKDQNLHGTFNDGGGDDLQITAETAPGTAGGTIAGSDDKDARVVVYFRLPKTLP